MHDFEKYISEKKPEEIINTLAQYFRNMENLQRFFKESQMIRAYTFLVKHKKLSSGIQDILLNYNNALKICKQDTISIFAATEEIAASKENIMHSAKQSTLGYGDIHNDVLSRLKYIGDTIEVSVKYILIEILALVKIQSKNVDYQKLMNINFGSAVQYFLDKNILTDILLTSPLQIRLSDWRNIAQHHSFVVQNEEIICEYKNDKKFTLSLDDLEHYVYQIANASNILNIARLFFFYDNHDDIVSAVKKMEINPPSLKSAIYEDNKNISILARKHGLVE